MSAAPSAPHISVVGAGIVGLWSAFELARRGYRVTVIEQNAHVGMGTSFANGAQLSYHYVQPLAGAGVLAQAMRWLLDDNAPLRWQPQFDVAQWRWLWQFARACNADTARATTARLYELALLSQHTLEQRLPELGAFSYQRTGKLVVYRSAAAFHAAQAHLIAPERQQIMSVAACVAIEPALADVAGQLVGGVFAPDDAVADCHALCTNLYAALAQSPHVSFCLGHTFEQVQFDAVGCVSGVGVRDIAGKRTLAVDGLILSAGVQTQAQVDALRVGNRVLVKRREINSRFFVR